MFAVLSMVAAACGGKAGGDKAGGTAVDIAEFSFKPPSLTVSVGATVTWTNKDGFAHSVKPDKDSFPTSPNIDQGKTFSHTFTKAGTYPYICGIHNSMTGTVIVK